MKKSSTQSPEVVDLIDAACDAEEMHAPGELDKWLEDDERRRRWAKEDGTPIDNEEAWFTANAKRIIRDLDSFTGDKRVEILGEELRAVAKAATLLTMEITKEGVGGRSPSEAATSEIPPVSEAGAPTICFNVQCAAEAIAITNGLPMCDEHSDAWHSLRLHNDLVEAYDRVVTTVDRWGHTRVVGGSHGTTLVPTRPLSDLELAEGKFCEGSHAWKLADGWTEDEAGGVSSGLLFCTNCHETLGIHPDYTVVLEDEIEKIFTIVREHQIAHNHVYKLDFRNGISTNAPIARDYIKAIFDAVSALKITITIAEKGDENEGN